jgi:DNA-binding XRE family transcriptional regulator
MVAGMPAVLLAREVGANPSAICLWEQGRRPIPLAYEIPLRDAIERYDSPGPEVWFWPKVDVRGPDECWPWTRGCVKGYGSIRRDRIARGTHRVAWELTYGPILDGLFVLHHCDNRPCCNPAHLFLGTQMDNVNDMVAKGRGRFRQCDNRRRGAANHNAKLTTDQVVEIRRLYAGRGITQAQLAVQFNVSRALICFIVTRRAWRHVP